MSLFNLDDLAAAFSGSVGQVVGTFAVFPLDLARVRMMADINRRTQLETLRRLWRGDGLAMYSAFPAKGIQQGWNRFTFYYLYGLLSRLFLIWTGRGPGAALTFLENLGVG